MANVQVIQRNAHLAGGVELEIVNGRDGKTAKAVLTAIAHVAGGIAALREVRISAIVDACFRLIVDGKTAPSGRAGEARKN